MRNIWTIARREYKLYFNSPMAYIVAFAFLVLLGLLFTNDLSDAVLRSSFQPISLGVEILLGPLIWMMLFIMMPAVTMRSLADEQRMGTLEILLTAPVRDRELVIGKWLGGMLLVLSIFAITLIYPLILNLLVDPGIDAGQLMAGYLGLILFAGALIAIGVAVSSFFSNPNAALVTNYVVVLLLWFIRPASQSGGDIGGQIIAYLNFIDHYVNFFRGVVDLRDITYYVSVIALSLFFGTISIRVPEVAVSGSRWRRFAPWGIYLSVMALLVAFGLFVIQRAWTFPLQISLSLAVLGLAIFSLLDPGRVRSIFYRRQGHYGGNLLVMILAFVGIVVVLNLLVYLNPRRWDLTAGRQQSLAPETIDTLNALEEPVFATAFYSAVTPDDLARELLDNYHYQSGGNFNYEIIDPEAEPIKASQANITRDGTIVLRMGERYRAGHLCR